MAPLLRELIAKVEGGGDDAGAVALADALVGGRSLRGDAGLQLAEALRAWDIGGVNCWCGAVDAVPKRDHSPACEFSRKALAAYEEARK